MNHNPFHVSDEELQAFAARAEDAEPSDEQLSLLCVHKIPAGDTSDFYRGMATAFVATAELLENPAPKLEMQHTLLVLAARAAQLHRSS